VHHFALITNLHTVWFCRW